MTKPLSGRTIEIIKATVPALEQHGAAITSVMYGRLFQDDNIRALFNHANQGQGGGQVHALAAAILAYARNIDNLGVLGPVVERIAHKHIGYDILPEHYPYVATALLGAIEEVLGALATPDILAAWGEAYWFLAEVLKSREVELREDIGALEGGWSGWRTLRVVDQIRESSLITSFILRPADGGPVMRHRPGQYLTFRFDAPGQQGLKRNYSISSAPGADHYRISVKREEAGNGGSRHLHDNVAVGDVMEATPPSGDFFLPDSPPHPVIMLSGGVGLTPMVSMVEAIAAEHPGVEAYYVHATVSSATHAMDRHVRSLAERHGKISVATFYSQPEPHDAVGKTHTADGFVTVDWLQRHTPLLSADIYLCGPKGFLRSLVAGLTAAGVSANRIHFEFFGPADGL